MSPIGLEGGIKMFLAMRSANAIINIDNRGLSYYQFLCEDGNFMDQLRSYLRLYVRIIATKLDSSDLTCPLALLVDV